MKKLYIMRGLPGSGKSSWIDSSIKLGLLPADTIIISADKYCYEKQEDGTIKYIFRQDKLAENHNKCLLETVENLQYAIPCVVIDNTSIKVWEFSPAYRLGEAYGYDVEIVYIVASPEVCKKRNLHSVPDQTIDIMFKSFEPVPLHWKVKVIINN